jgi:hypothetical protein
MEDYSSGVWAMTFLFGAYSFYVYYKDRVRRPFLWIGITNFVLTVWALYESWSYGLLKEDIKYGINLIVVCSVIGVAGKIFFNWRKKKKEAFYKERDKAVQKPTKEIKINRNKEINTSEGLKEFEPDDSLLREDTYIDYQVETIREDTIFEDIELGWSFLLLEKQSYILLSEHQTGEEAKRKYRGNIPDDEIEFFFTIKKKDLGKFTYDLILKYLIASNKVNDYHPRHNLELLCNEYRIKYYIDSWA